MNRPSQVLSVATALLQAALVSLEHVSKSDGFNESASRPGELNDTVQSIASRLAMDCLCAAIYGSEMGTCHYVHVAQESDEKVFSRSFPALEGPRAFTCGLRESFKVAAPMIAEDDRPKLMAALTLVEGNPATKLADALSASDDRGSDRDTVVDFFGVSKVEVPSEEVAGE